LDRVLASALAQEDWKTRKGLDFGFGSGRSENQKGLKLRFWLTKIGKPERAQTSVLAHEDRKTRKGSDFGSSSGRSENQKGLGLRFWLRKIGKPEGAQTSVLAQEDWKAGRGPDFGFGSGRSKGWRKLRQLTTGGPESASWKDRQAERAQAREADGKTGASQRSRKAERRR